MIRVTVELVSAKTGATTILGQAKIVNDGTGQKSNGNYKAYLSKRGRGFTLWKTVEVKGFPRKRLLMWDLLYRVLKEAVGDRNP